QLQADINNVASTASFNGVNLLDGTFQGATFQVGANVGQTITVSSVASASTSALGTLYTAANATAPTGAVTAGDVANISFSVGGTTYTTANFTSSGTAATDVKTAVAAINALSGQDGGIVATVDGTSGAIDFSSTAGLKATLGAVNSVSHVGATQTLTGATLGLAATYDMSSGGTPTKTNLNVGAVTTVDGSNLALAQIDAALQQVAATGAQLGAYQNRFQSAISGLNTDSTNLQSARSQIQDTDYAAATSQLSKAQILQQASTAMVAQANMIPQNILTLLQKLP
ncbi:MAG: flagellin, partial [Gammaproteobacteria bacterium]|nr:flagellin [Gammaproteobacteria bacterium]